MSEEVPGTSTARIRQDESDPSSVPPEPSVPSPNVIDPAIVGVDPSNYNLRNPGKVKASLPLKAVSFL